MPPTVGSAVPQRVSLVPRPRSIILILSPLPSSNSGRYPYTEDLLHLHAASAKWVQWLPPELWVVESPLKQQWSAWAASLSTHPDKAFVTYVLTGIWNGFRIGWHNDCPLTPAKRNSPSALQQAHVVEQYLSAEITANRVIGPFPVEALPGLQISRMGVIPKGHILGKWRLIIDLSFPPGNSVNDGIDVTWWSLQYTSVEKVARAAQSLGKGALMAKVDIQSAYHLVPVHPSDRLLLGVRWYDACYVDGMLPFGLRLAPKIFTAVADALEWCLRQQGVSAVDHYLDDFITIGPPNNDVCQRNLQTISAVCESLGGPTCCRQDRGPTSCLTHLGIEIDTVAGILCLPREKLDRLRADLQRRTGRKTCRRRQLESLIGLLHYACRVVRPGRSFLRHMIALLQHAHCPYHHIRLTKQFSADVAWWRTFIVMWNGVGIFPPMAQPTVEFTSDASGNWGCGAWSGTAWFQFQWPQGAAHRHIAFLELVAVLLACTVWARHWHGQSVLCRCNNQAAVQVISS